MKLKKRGFTLIKLLVVVLIIGILAAIALPQYRKAALKSKYFSLFQATNALLYAEEEYYLANGAYTGDFNKLSITVPNTNCCSFRLYPQDNPILVIGTKNNAIAYQVRFKSKETGNGQRLCRAAIASPQLELAKQVCKEITGVEPMENDGNYVSYYYGHI
jgi:type IV pilus assembly protein PilE